jgi:hypothetical protein
MIKINGDTINPRLNMAAVCEYKAITGVDLLFQGIDINIDTFREIAFVMLKHGDGNTKIKNVEDIDGLSMSDIKKTLVIFTKAMTGEDDKKKAETK